MKVDRIRNLARQSAPFASFHIVDDLPPDVYAVTDRESGLVLFARDAPLESIVHEAFHLALARRSTLELDNEERAAQMIEATARELIDKVLKGEGPVSFARRRGVRAGAAIAFGTLLTAASAFAEGYQVAKLVSNSAITPEHAQRLRLRLHKWVTVIPENDQTRALLGALVKIINEIGV